MIFFMGPPGFICTAVLGTWIAYHRKGMRGVLAFWLFWMPFAIFIASCVIWGANILDVMPFMLALCVLCWAATIVFWFYEPGPAGGRYTRQQYISRGWCMAPGGGNPAMAVAHVRKEPRLK